MRLNDIIIDLLNYALDCRIGFELTYELDDHTTSLSDTHRRKIIINMGYYRQHQIPLQIGHEITHVNHADRSYHNLIGYDSLYSDPLTENSANQGAIHLLLPYYLRDKNPEQINIYTFMNYFDIPDHLTQLVKLEINNYVKNCILG